MKYRDWSKINSFEALERNSCRGTRYLPTNHIDVPQKSLKCSVFFIEYIQEKYNICCYLLSCFFHSFLFKEIIYRGSAYKYVGISKSLETVLEDYGEHFVFPIFFASTRLFNSWRYYINIVICLIQLIIKKILFSLKPQKRWRVLASMRA